jgi:hypothetical protein
LLDSAGDPAWLGASGLGATIERQTAALYPRQPSMIRISITAAAFQAIKG